MTDNVESSKGPARGRWIRAIAAALCLAIGWCWWHLEDNFHVVATDVIYRSAQPSAEDLDRYQRDHGLKTVINLRGYWPNETWYQKELEATRQLGLNYHEVPLITHRQTSMQNLRDLITIFDECPKPMLVHCRQGADRTSLAAAVYLLLYKNKTPAEALEAYQLSYGHTGWAYGYHLPHLFDCYQQWLAEMGETHSPDNFRRWTKTETTIGYFGNSWSTVSFPSPVPGKAMEFTIAATNTSKQAWILTDPFHDGIHLVVKIVDGDGKEVEELYVGSTPGSVGPGGKANFRVTVPAESVRENYQFRAELVDPYGIRFGLMGASRWIHNCDGPVTLPKNVANKARDSVKADG